MNLILIAWGLNHTAVGTTPEQANVNPPYGALGSAASPYALMTSHSQPYGLFGEPTTKPYATTSS